MADRESGGRPRLTLSRVKKEVRAMLALALPSIATNASQQAMLVTDQIFVGHLGTKRLAAAAIGTTYFNLLWFFLLGMTSAMDTLGSQAYGVGDYHSMNTWLFAGLWSISGWCIPATVLLLVGEPVAKHVFHQPDDIARLVGTFCSHLAPGIWPLMWGVMLMKYLQVQNIMRPPALAAALSFVCNIGLNWLMIHFLGFAGAPLATTLSRTLQFFFLLGAVALVASNRKGRPRPPPSFTLSNPSHHPDPSHHPASPPHPNLSDRALPPAPTRTDPTAPQSPPIPNPTSNGASTLPARAARPTSLPSLPTPIPAPPMSTDQPLAPHHLPSNSIATDQLSQALSLLHMHPSDPHSDTLAPPSHPSAPHSDALAPPSHPSAPQSDALSPALEPQRASTAHHASSPPEQTTSTSAEPATSSQTPLPSEPAATSAPSPETTTPSPSEAAATSAPAPEATTAPAPAPEATTARAPAPEATTAPDDVAQRDRDGSPRAANGSSHAVAVAGAAAGAKPGTPGSAVGIAAPSSSDATPAADVAAAEKLPRSDHAGQGDQQQRASLEVDARSRAAGGEAGAVALVVPGWGRREGWRGQVATCVCMGAQWPLLWQFLKLGIPGGVMLALEASTFEVSTALAGLLGEVQLAAHSVMLGIATFTFVAVPFAVAVASTIRVGNLLGAKRPRAAKLAAVIAVSLCTGIMLVMGALIVGLRHQIGRVFVKDPKVLRQIARIAPYCAGFQPLDGLQGTSQGILRGMGKQSLVAVFNLVGFWGIGLTTEYAATFPGGLGLPGLWVGLLVGLTATSIFNITTICLTNWDREAERAQAASLQPPPEPLFDPLRDDDDDLD